MIRIINTPFYDDFIKLCVATKNSIKLCAPFVKHDIVDNILNGVISTVSVDLITNMNLMSFLHHVEAKIRQTLQHLRDLGLIKFISAGVYEKLWI
jgi:hypothetical protein